MSLLTVFVLAAGAVCPAAGSSQFKMLRGTKENWTVEDVKRQEDLEYPGNNQRILSVLNQMWERYYACLVTKTNPRRPEIRRLLEGQNTELECDICTRPFQNYEELEWRYKPLDPNQGIEALEYLDLTPEMTFTENKTIRIFNAVEALSGLYVCYHKESVASIYILEVSRNDTMKKVQRFPKERKRIFEIDGREFEVSYRWSQRTECSFCGRLGRTFKYGTCFVRQREERVIVPVYFGTVKNRIRRRPIRDQRLAQPRDSNCSEATTRGPKEDTTWRNPKDRQAKVANSTPEYEYNPDWDLEIMEKFSTGVPCASRYLPRSLFQEVRRLPPVKVLVNFCWEPCRVIEIFEVFDSQGRLVETANNTAGIYSLFQKPPQVPHDIERRTVDAEFGSDIIIQCPGTSFTNTPVHWKINRQIIFPDLIAKESNGRFTVDLVNRIHIKKLRLKDSRIYSCWQKDNLVGTVHLIVEKKFKIVFDHHVTLLGMIAVIGVLLLLGSKILARELKMRKKK